MELQIICSPRHQWLHSSEILEWRDYLGECCKRTIITNNELRFSALNRSTFKTRLYLFVKRKSSKALASSGHMVSNLPEEVCCRATGNPMDSTLSRDKTASFQVLSDGQAYFNPSGIFKVWREIKREYELLGTKEYIYNRCILSMSLISTVPYSRFNQHRWKRSFTSTLLLFCFNPLGMDLIQTRGIKYCLCISSRKILSVAFIYSVECIGELHCHTATMSK